MTERTLLPNQWQRAVEMTARSLPPNASLDTIAASVASKDVKVVPLRRRASGRGYEPVPLPGGFHDPWDCANYDLRGIRQHRERWQRADAIGVKFAYAEHAFFVLDPDDRVLRKFVQHVDASMR
jgi:hypothetical protein